ncbi:MAG: hypothetical protein FJX35_18445 [Alphaproteobacteria bacterium]|nr:hypothetical protein [Alphaproteobacteria bacterium]
MQLESGGNATARAATSTAAGAFQFTDSTWLDLIARSGAQVGLAREAALIGRSSAGQPVVADPDERTAILALRERIGLAAALAQELADANARHLTARLGRPPDRAELYLAHFLGARGAAALLAEAGEGNGDRPAADLLPRAATANRDTFFRGGTAVSTAALVESAAAAYRRAETTLDLSSNQAPGDRETDRRQSSTAPPGTAGHPAPPRTTAATPPAGWALAFLSLLSISSLGLAYADGESDTAPGDGNFRSPGFLLAHHGARAIDLVA